MYKYIFGPVPSRRLGISLGIDLLQEKICTLNCVYCECGSTKVLTTDRHEFVPTHEVIEEISDFLSQYEYPDYITFSGSGEPTLHSGIGEIISFLKKEYPDVPVAVLTNGTLLYDSQVRKELMGTDLVIPSIDSALESSYLKINRPKKGLSLEDYIRGLVDFSSEFDGQIWLEVFILPDYNDSDEDLDALEEVIRRINPDRVQLNTMDRPGAITGLRKATHQDLRRIMERWNIENVEIISKFVKRDELRSYNKNKEEAILETVSRRPCTLDDLVHVTGLHKNEVNKYLDVLEESGSIMPVMLDRGIFYQKAKQ